MSRHHPTSPCANCPYRVDAPRRHWDRSEFRKLLASEGTELGVVYACHNHARVAPKDRGMCAGWLLDQKNRGIPSIRLRLVLSRNEPAREAFALVSSGGHKLFRTVKSMCRANGVR